MQFFDRVQQTTATTGTGTYTLSASAADGFVAISSRYADGAEVPYCCTDDTDFEVGVGTYTASGNTLSRDTILASSNSGAAVSWGSGDKKLFVTLPAAAVNRMNYGIPLFFLDGSMVAGVPVDRIGAFDFTVGSYGLTAETISGGTLDGRPAIVAAAEIGSNINFSGTEEMRITGAVTLAGWVKLTQTTLGTLISCNGSGETLATNILYDLRLGPNVFSSTAEYGSGTDSNSNNSESIEGYAGEWLFVVFSRQNDGRTIGLSVWNDTDQQWTDSQLLLPTAAQKATAANTQVLSLLAYSSAIAGPGMSCAAMAMWPKYFGLPERRAMKDIFFTLA